MPQNNEIMHFYSRYIECEKYDNGRKKIIYINQENFFGVYLIREGYMAYNHHTGESICQGESFLYF